MIIKPIIIQFNEFFLFTIHNIATTKGITNKYDLCPVTEKSNICNAKTKTKGIHFFFTKNMTKSAGPIILANQFNI